MENNFYLKNFFKKSHLPLLKTNLIFLFKFALILSLATPQHSGAKDPATGLGSSGTEVTDTNKDPSGSGVSITVKKVTHEQADVSVSKAATEGAIPNNPMVITVDQGSGPETLVTQAGGLTQVSLQRDFDQRVKDSVERVANKNQMRFLSETVGIRKKINDVSSIFQDHIFQDQRAVTAIFLKLRVPAMAAGLYVTMIVLLGSHSSLDMVTKLFLVATIINYFQTTHFFHGLLEDGGIRNLLTSTNRKAQEKGLAAIINLLRLPLLINWTSGDKRQSLIGKLDQLLTMYGISIGTLSILSYLEGAHFNSLTLVMLSFIFMWDFLFESTSAMLQRENLITQAILRQIGAVRISIAPMVEAAALVGATPLAPAFMAIVGVLGFIGVISPKPTANAFKIIRDAITHLLTDADNPAADAPAYHLRHRAAHLTRVLFLSTAGLGLRKIREAMQTLGRGIGALGNGIGNLAVDALTPTLPVGVVGSPRSGGPASSGRTPPPNLKMGLSCFKLLKP